MNNYNFQKKEELNLDETIRLDLVNEQVKSFDEKRAMHDDLGDENDYLETFNSERIDNNQRNTNQRNNNRNNYNNNNNRDNQRYNGSRYSDDDYNDDDYDDDGYGDDDYDYGYRENVPQRGYNNQNGNPNMRNGQNPNGNPNMRNGQNPNGNPNMRNGQNPNGNPNMRNEQNPNGNPNMRNGQNPNGNPNMRNGQNPNGNPNMRNGQNPNGNPNMRNGQNPNGNPNMRNGQDQRRPQQQRQSPPKNELFTQKNMAMMGGGVVVLMVLVFMLSKVMFTDKVSTNVGVMENPMMIQSFLDNGQVVLFDISKNTDVGLSLTEESQVTVSGTTVNSLEQFEIGDIIMVASNDKKEIISASEAKNVVEQNIKSVEADLSNNKLVTMNNGVSYSYHNKTNFTYNGRDVDPSTIHTTDVLTAKSYNGVLWDVKVVKSHGYFDIENKSKIQDGVIQINKEAGINIADFKAITLAEGTHDITITGKNIETVVNTIVIEPSRTYTYDLALAQEKQIVVLLNPNVTDYKLYVDNVLMGDTTQVIKPIGNYKFRIEKDGYLPWEETVSVEGATINLKPTLEAEIIFGKVSVTSEVYNAKVYLDGEYVGKVPYETELEYGAYSVEVVADGFVPFVNTINVNEENIDVKAEMELEEIEMELEVEEEVEEYEEQHIEDLNENILLEDMLI